MTRSDLLNLLGLLLAAAAVTGVTIWIVGFLSGWRELARRYPARPALPGARRGWCATLWMGRAGYGRCVNWAADDEFLHLRLWPVLGLAGHAPISVPWAAVEFEAPRRGGLLSRALGRVRFAPLRSPPAAVEVAPAPRRTMVRAVVGGRVRCALPLAMVARELEVRGAMLALGDGARTA